MQKKLIILMIFRRLKKWNNNKTRAESAGAQCKHVVWCQLHHKKKGPTVKKTCQDATRWDFLSLPPSKAFYVLGIICGDPCIGKTHA